MAFDKYSFLAGLAVGRRLSLMSENKSAKQASTVNVVSEFLKENHAEKQEEKNAGQKN